MWLFNVLFVRIEAGYVASPWNYNSYTILKLFCYNIVWSHKEGDLILFIFWKASSNLKWECLLITYALSRVLSGIHRDFLKVLEVKLTLLPRVAQKGDHLADRGCRQKATSVGLITVFNLKNNLFSAQVFYDVIIQRWKG